MRRLAAIAVVAGGAVTAAAQTPPISAGPTAGGGFQMPGQNVGGYQLTPVGQRLQAAAAAAGQRVGANPGNVATLPDVSTQLPGGAAIDPRAVVGPLPDSLRAAAEPTLWQKFVAKFGDALGLTSPAPAAPTYTPGLSRRNRDRSRERNLRTWWRD